MNVLTNCIGKIKLVRKIRQEPQQRESEKHGK